MLGVVGDQGLKRCATLLPLFALLARKLLQIRTLLQFQIFEKFTTVDLGGSGEVRLLFGHQDLKFTTSIHRRCQPIGLPIRLMTLSISLMLCSIAGSGCSCPRKLDLSGQNSGSQMGVQHWFGLAQINRRPQRPCAICYGQRAPLRSIWIGPSKRIWQVYFC
ncbi:MAG: hypothetical protein R2856_07755 [Caldilineaceae bacterium]